MVIKVDLEKAYDLLHWDFFINTLKDLSFNNHFVSIIKHCMDSCSMQVLANKEKTMKFIPTRGIQQGEPLFLFLFVLYMECFSHLINRSVENKECKHVVLSRKGSLISHLFFIDDLLLLGQTSTKWRFLGIAFILFVWLLEKWWV